MGSTKQQLETEDLGRPYTNVLTFKDNRSLMDSFSPSVLQMLRDEDLEGFSIDDVLHFIKSELLVLDSIVSFQRTLDILPPGEKWNSQRLKETIHVLDNLQSPLKYNAEYGQWLCGSINSNQMKYMDNLQSQHSNNGTRIIQCKLCQRFTNLESFARHLVETHSNNLKDAGEGEHMIVGELEETVETVDVSKNARTKLINHQNILGPLSPFFYGTEEDVLKLRAVDRERRKHLSQRVYPNVRNFKRKLRPTFERSKVQKDKFMSAESITEKKEGSLISAEEDSMESFLSSCSNVFSMLQAKKETQNKYSFLKNVPYQKDVSKEMVLASEAVGSTTSNIPMRRKIVNTHHMNNLRERKFNGDTRKSDIVENVTYLTDSGRLLLPQGDGTEVAALAASSSSSFPSKNNSAMFAVNDKNFSSGVESVAVGTCNDNRNRNLKLSQLPLPKGKAANNDVSLGNISSSVPNVSVAPTMLRNNRMYQGGAYVVDGSLEKHNPPTEWNSKRTANKIYASTNSNTTTIPQQSDSEALRMNLYNGNVSVPKKTQQGSNLYGIDYSSRNSELGASQPRSLPTSYSTDPTKAMSKASQTTIQTSREQTKASKGRKRTGKTPITKRGRSFLSTTNEYPSDSIPPERDPYSIPIQSGMENIMRDRNWSMTSTPTNELQGLTGQSYMYPTDKPNVSKRNFNPNNIESQLQELKDDGPMRHLNELMGFVERKLVNQSESTKHSQQEKAKLTMGSSLLGVEQMNKRQTSNTGKSSSQPSLESRKQWERQDLSTLSNGQSISGLDFTSGGGSLMNSENSQNGFVPLYNRTLSTSQQPGARYANPYGEEDTLFMSDMRQAAQSPNSLMSDRTENAHEYSSNHMRMLPISRNEGSLLDNARSDLSSEMLYRTQFSAVPKNASNRNVARELENSLVDSPRAANFRPYIASKDRTMEFDYPKESTSQCTNAHMKTISFGGFGPFGSSTNDSGIGTLSRRSSNNSQQEDSSGMLQNLRGGSIQSYVMNCVPNAEYLYPSELETNATQPSPSRLDRRSPSMETSRVTLSTSNHRRKEFFSRANHIDEGSSLWGTGDIGAESSQYNRANDC